MLTPERITELSDRLLRVVGAGYVRPQDADGFARAIEAEVRKQDTELIRQMLESMCWAARVIQISEDDAPGYWKAMAAARARLTPW